MNETWKGTLFLVNVHHLWETFWPTFIKSYFLVSYPLICNLREKSVPVFGNLLIYEWHIPTTLCYAPFPLGSYISKKSEKFLRIVSVLKALGYIFLFKNMYIFLAPSLLKFFMTINHPSLSWQCKLEQNRCTFN